MGYDLHITRADDWARSEAAPISLKEWVAYVESQPDMRLDNAAIIDLPDGKLRYENDGIAVWTGYSRNEPGGTQAWFDYRDGRVVVNNPDQELLARMLSIAHDFSAHVVGDEGESYTKPNDIADESNAKTWWKFW